MIRKVIGKDMYVFKTREKLNVIAKKRHGSTENRLFAYRKIYNDFSDNLTNVQFGKIYKIRRMKLEASVIRMLFDIHYDKRSALMNSYKRISKFRETLLLEVV